MPVVIVISLTILISWWYSYYTILLCTIAITILTWQLYLTFQLYSQAVTVWSTLRVVTVFCPSSEGVLLPYTESELILPRYPTSSHTAGTTGVCSRRGSDGVLGDEVRVGICDAPVNENFTRHCINCCDVLRCQG